MKDFIKKYKEKFFIWNKDFGRISLFIFFIFFFIIFICVYINFFIEKDLEVSFFDIGQGDAALVQTPNGENILIDAGPDTLILHRLSKKLSIFNNDIDLAIMSHPDSDHIAGFISVFEDYDIKNILENGDNQKGSDVYEETLEKIKLEKEKLSSNIYIANCGDKINLYKNTFNNKDNEKSLDMYILSPLQNNMSTLGTNENSIVILLIYGDYSFLFTGDMTKEIEKKIFLNIDNCFNNVDAEQIKIHLKNLTVLKVSHHGSNTASSEDFLKKIKPKYSIISAGKNNRYGHPNLDTLNLINRYSEYTFNTINDGNIYFSTNGKDFTFNKSK